MSKRKSSSQTLQTADMTFEDDDFEDQQTESIAGDSRSQGSREGSRVSVRAKKAKAIYDPSEYNGPVHKRKIQKEAMEARMEALQQNDKMSKTPTKAVKETPDHRQKSQILSPVKAIQPTIVQEKVSDVPFKAKTPTKRSSLQKNKTVIDEKISVQNKKPTPVPVRKLSAIPTVPLVKEPSKRIQARKQQKVHNNEPTTSTGVRKQREDSLASTNEICSDEYDQASTIEFRNSEVPDVRKWTHQQVFEYFNKNLGFLTRDAAVFKDEEIDGEALMIMKRSDIVTTKFQKLKLGTALKMWSQIIMFQTGSNDPTQAWK